MQQELWDFAAALYARPALAQHCLTAQDEYGADVCLLLTALWLEQRGQPLDRALAARLQQVAGDWQQAVCTPLRTLRRAWKAAAATDAALAGLRQQLASLELDAERCLLARLQQCIDAWPRTSTPDALTGDWLGALLPAPAAAGLAAALREQARPQA
ncbi:TIGR02444 family protein [Pseudomonas sp. NW5]|uniref:TIGR02444 family protein n=1 Tax=Pseudomonas sp. NW5 TaxID=2934934 RepID=UPI002022880F|nr:TIGR02444 family protein [Pseudomonas sp. NW5]MCL7462723.1 TIGR02444 family protein [Pseudomonas sp. NW5]